MTHPPYYHTNDPYLASFVLNQGAVLVRYRRLGPKKVEFRFLADQKLHWLLFLYWHKVRTLVVPASLFDTLRKLKKRSFKLP